MKTAPTEASCCDLSDELARMVNAVCRANMDNRVVGCGLDVVPQCGFEWSVELAGQIFLDRIFTTFELDYARGDMVALAQNFAAKEAVSKALGTGIRGVRWHDIEISFGASTAALLPHISLQANAQLAAIEQNIVRWELCTSHTSEFAIAFAVAWRRDLRNLSN